MACPGPALNFRQGSNLILPFSARSKPVQGLFEATAVTVGPGGVPDGSQAPPNVESE